MEAVPTANIAHDTNRFFINPKDHIDLRREARRRDVEVLGFYHSHPRTPAAPSAADCAEAAYPGHLYLIVSLTTDPPQVRLFRFENASFVDVVIVEET